MKLFGLIFVTVCVVDARLVGADATQSKSMFFEKIHRDAELSDDVTCKSSGGPESTGVCGRLHASGSPLSDLLDVRT